jgi:glycosyltransferase involved in cell wall biosynthesis
MRKIFYILDSLQTGGAEKSTLDIASRLKEFEPVVCHIYENDFLKPQFEQRGIRVISLDIKGPYNFLRAYRTLKKILHEEKPDLVVVSLLRSELISRVACYSLGIPNVGTFVNDTYSKFEIEAISMTMKLKVGFFWIFNMLTAKLCAGFLSNSESVKASNCRALFIPEEKVKVIYRGRRTEQFSYAEKIPGVPKKFLAIGRLLYRKGFEELVVAFAAYHKQYPDATLTIAGDGPFRKRIETLIHSYSLQDDVTLAGTITDTHGAMASHDVFVFPSHYEGFSGTLVEAMLSGIPVIASSIAMNAEAIEHKRTGWLFAVKEPKAIEEALLWVTHHFPDAISFARQARIEAEQRFDIDIIARQHEQYYAGLIQSTRS